MGSHLNFIDLFSGAGGLSCGLELSGHRCLLGVDMNTDAMKTFALNHRHAQVFDGPIQKLTIQKIAALTNHQTVDMVVGGPPCQGFSTVGLGNPLDERNKLFEQFVRVVKQVRPRYLIMENVTGLLAKKNEKVLKRILAKFGRLGYQLNIQVMASELYGVPEKRRRTILIGTLRNIPVVFPKITHGESLKPIQTVSDALKKIKTSSGKIHNHDVDSAQLKDLLDKKRLARIPEGKGIRYQQDERKYLTPKLYYGVNWEELPEQRFRQAKLQRLDRQKPAPTIMTHRQTYYHPTENRYLTQREAAAIQSFPASFKFLGSVTSQWRQIGNAVPPLLGKALGEAIKKMEKTQTASLLENIQPLALNKERSRAFVYQPQSGEPS